MLRHKRKKKTLQQNATYLAIFEVSVCWNFNLSLNKRKEKKVFLIFDFDKNTVQNFFLNVKIITI